MGPKKSWFLTPSGFRFSKTIAISAAAGGFLIYYLPNGPLIDKFREVTQLYKDGMAVRLSHRVTSLVEAVMNDLGMSENKRHFIKTYTGYGFDLFHAGSFPVTSSGVVGIPMNYRYEHVNEFQPAGITINNEAVKWGTREGHSLRDALVLSDEAKKFAIAKELAHVESVEPIVTGVFSSSVILMSYAISSTVNLRMNYYAKPRLLRLCLYGLTSLFGYATWILCKDMSCLNYEASADETAANISEAYARGGLEFYEKILQRNIALRSLMGETGEDKYTAYGNDQIALRTKHIPFTVRRDYMKKRLQEYSEKKAEEKATDPVSKVEDKGNNTENAS